MISLLRSIFYKNNWWFVILIFVLWKGIIFGAFFTGIHFLPLQQHFIGGGQEQYHENPYLWAWANFDGEHYLSIAQKGYGNGEEPFFPLFPFLIRLTGQLFDHTILTYQIIGLVISHTAFFIALVGLWKLITLDFSSAIARVTLILLVVFPTSFYFGSVYTESLFLSLVIWAFFTARKGYWWVAGLLGLLAAATRFIGILLIPALLFEWYLQNKNQQKKNFISLIPIGCIAVGLLGYMYYLQQSTGDPLGFIHKLTLFGEQRSSTPILLPQVIWRYIKIGFTTSFTNTYLFVYILELCSAILFLAGSIAAFWKVRMSYAWFAIFAYIAPTLSGSFSSFPRYALVLFPVFIVAAQFLSNRPLWLRLTAVSMVLSLLIIATALFSRGYWIA